MVVALLGVFNEDSREKEKEYGGRFSRFYFSYPCASDTLFMVHSTINVSKRYSTMLRHFETFFFAFDQFSKR